MKPISKNAMKCKKCGMVLHSLHRHDFRQCECGNFVDGGLAYSRCGGNLDDLEDLREYEEA